MKAASVAGQTDRTEAWYRLAKAARWGSFVEVRRTFPSADQIGSVLIFDLGRNHRLIVRVNYRQQKLFFKALLTHQEYDRKEWMKWAR
ncbi:MAG: type II toxin-antitoxin system HigB family toxin [Bryobacteraceae bacterium]|nr:type II toxin-antitoxin system HigB family toxin [Bryobacteraceae bacterium]